MHEAQTQLASHGLDVAAQDVGLVHGEALVYRLENQIVRPIGAHRINFAGSASGAILDDQGLQRHDASNSTLVDVAKLQKMHPREATEPRHPSSSTVHVRATM